jgi:hypothetical protein
MKRKIERQDILSERDYLAVRNEKKTEIISLKKSRRIFVGPFITFFFESYETLWWQIHEMLRIEKGGEDQIKDELFAYNPLIPQGEELVATMMIELGNPIERAEMLSKLGHIEQMVQFRFGGHTITATPEDDQERTTKDGKTSAVHFLRWHFTKDQIALFSQANEDIILEITHPSYTYKQLLSEENRQVLMKDFGINF